MVAVIIIIHLAIVLVSSSLVYYVGRNLLNRSDKYAFYSWIAFSFFVLLMVIYMTYHCFDVIAYYRESALSFR